jgi:nitrogen fixation/metabolism regulation signal transduction histidine kinase
MVDELEQSANLLAESERETAWREMAKQVAHEIKNPLTPMKLNVQFLEQSLKQQSK